ncbi:MAG: PIN domain-containing protein [Thermoplasmata archaeon]
MEVFKLNESVIADDILSRTDDKYVLDTSAILSGKDVSLDKDMYIPPSVMDEIKKGGRWYNKLQRLLAGGLNIVTPPGPYIVEVTQCAKHTGDYLRLSSTDIEVLALALHLEAVVVTDDYSIQNLAKALGIKFKGLAVKEIKNEYKWGYRCVKCYRLYKEPVEDCLVCGGEVKTTRLTRESS